MPSEFESKSPAAGEGCLFIVATPIGNLGDMTFRAVETLKNVNTVLCEDSRVTRVLLSHFGITTPLGLYHDHNADQARPQILSRLQAGELIALVSDAGTPLISDPGYKLVRDAQEMGIRVVPIPGVSALTTAICASGLPSDCLTFAGFLPTKSGARRSRLNALMPLPHTIILYESPHRLIDLLGDIAHHDRTRDVVIARELTKRFEEIVRGNVETLLADWSKRAAIKGEVVVLIAPNTTPHTQWSDMELDALLRDALQHGSVKDAAAQAALLTGLPKSDLYHRALKLKSE